MKISLRSLRLGIALCMASAALVPTTSYAGESAADQQILAYGKAGAAPLTRADTDWACESFFFQVSQTYAPDLYPPSSKTKDDWARALGAHYNAMSKGDQQMFHIKRLMVIVGTEHYKIKNDAEKAQTRAAWKKELLDSNSFGMLVLKLSANPAPSAGRQGTTRPTYSPAPSTSSAPSTSRVVRTPPKPQDYSGLMNSARQTFRLGQSSGSMTSGNYGSSVNRSTYGKQ